jgi:hypothetical protein
MTKRRSTRSAKSVKQARSTRSQPPKSNATFQPPPKRPAAYASVGGKRVRLRSDVSDTELREAQDRANLAQRGVAPNTTRAYAGPDSVFGGRPQ